MRSNLHFAIIILVILLIILVSLLAPWIAPQNPNRQQMQLRNQGPSPDHLLGTDNLGRDVLSRVLYGGRITLLISFSATMVSMMVGIFLGSLAGWFGSWLDAALQIVMSIFQGIPSLSITIAVVGILGTKNSSIFIALILTGWSGVARLVRSQVRSLKDQQFIEASRIYLPGSLYMILFHILPLLLPSLFVLATNRMGRMILSIASLSFIGVGLQPPTPDWGVMIQDARLYMRQQPWPLLAPAIMIFISSFTLNRLGEQLRNKLDIYQSTMVSFK